jgi:DNA gyrase subunit A
MLITDAGKVIRTPVKGISIIGRNTQGVRLIDLESGEKVVGVATLGEKETEEESGSNGGEGDPEPEGTPPEPTADA